MRKAPEPVRFRLKSLYRAFRGERPTFSGWGLETYTTHTPWLNQPDQVSQSLISMHAEFKDALDSSEFVLTQFSGEPDIACQMDGFLWREYFIVASVTLAARVNISGHSLSLVECGVCDGWSTWFALKRATQLADGTLLWAFDSWAGMREVDLFPSEISRAGNYEYLELNQTQQNLKQFGDRVRFCPGYLPESLGVHGLPAIVHWLHIDLNAAIPTEATLKHLWDRIPPGGVILLDDYDWPGYEDTKKVADGFFAEVGQFVIALPTGQGLVVRSP